LLCTKRIFSRMRYIQSLPHFLFFRIWRIIFSVLKNKEIDKEEITKPYQHVYQQTFRIWGELVG